MGVPNYKDVQFTSIYRVRNKTKHPAFSKSCPAASLIIVSVLNLKRKESILQ